jgi:hypothetical protein
MEQISTAANVAAVRTIVRSVHFCLTIEMAGPKLAGWSAFNPEGSFIHWLPGTERHEGDSGPAKTETADDITVGRYFTVINERRK